MSKYTGTIDVIAYIVSHHDQYSYDFTGMLKEVIRLQIMFDKVQIVSLDNALQKFIPTIFNLNDPVDAYNFVRYDTNYGNGTGYTYTESTKDNKRIIHYHPLSMHIDWGNITYTE